MSNKLIKHFCRLITREDLDNDDVIIFFDIVQSVAHTKLVSTYDDQDGKSINVEVIAYHNDGDNIYEIVLEEDMSIDDGDMIALELDKEFDFDFDFEASTEE